ncbi:alanine racemase [Paenibacillus herberti]|uniref:Alanine racemase n=1 Tax=Paenibacillus herberti TaxID=1619309 RepID=A0A229NVB1_9BACL|nr:alanine racemase [Paenibacillus herberti]OXM13770.1 alanine racemase [Paenibacillus herberti]
MYNYYRPTRAEISLDALRSNIGTFRSSVPDGMKLLASVKANAYGHGLIQISQEAEACGVDYLGVAFLDEAIQIRRSGVMMPILVLGYVPPNGLDMARSLDITIALFRDDVLKAARSLPENSSKKLKVHIKLDTGMGRLGKLADGSADAMRFIEAALRVPQLGVEGLFTHFAKSDEADKNYTKLQHERFAAVVHEVRSRSLPIEIVHSANTAAGIDTPELGGDMLRLGIGMYGLYPSPEVDHSKVRLKPVLSLKTEVVMVKELRESWGISYGTRYFAEAGERIGTIPIGYADGFSRLLTGKAHVLIRGQRVPVLGTICMDQCMISLGAAEAAGGGPVATEEEAVLIGSQLGAEITAEEVADQLGTINYELICMLAARVPRVYMRNGRVVAVSNALDAQ